MNADAPSTRSGEASALRVHVLLFAHAADLAGSRRIDLLVPADARVQDLWTALRSQSPAAADALAPLRGVLAVARNRRYAASHEPLADGDEVAFIPPVSGG